MDAIEFMSRDDGRVTMFTPTSMGELVEGDELTEELYETIARSYPWAFEALSVAYASSELNLKHYHYLKNILIFSITMQALNF